MNLDLSKVDKNIKSAITELSSLLGINSKETCIKLQLEYCEKGFEIKLCNNKAIIGYSNKCEFFRALGILKEHYMDGCFELSEQPAFESLGIMADNSRNAVNNISTIKKLIRIMALMGYNMLMLYTEDTYEIKDYPYFGYMRGRFTRAEVAEIQNYAGLFGIELIPCIQTLAHLNSIFRWNVFGNIRDINDILLVDEPKTYDLLDNMFKSISESFESRRVNIGLDEAFFLGRGRYLDEHGLVPKTEIMLKHLSQVIKLCKKYGLKPMMWSDMFFRNSDGNFSSLPDDIKETLTLIHWDYVTEAPEHCEQSLSQHLSHTSNVMFAGGAWKWEGFVPFISYSLITSRNALIACKNKGIKEIMVTAWGDDGGDASLFSVLPVFQLFAEDCYTSDTSEGHLKKRLKACANADFDDFVKLELPNLPIKGEIGGGYITNPAKYMLYQDVLCGLYDKHVKEDEFAAHYKLCISFFKEARERNPEWQYIFDLFISLCEVLEIKCDIGIKLKAAYDRNDKAELHRLVLRLSVLKNKIEQLHDMVKKQWLYENKPFGLEVQDIRIGGLKARVDTAVMRLYAYLNSDIDRIEELEQERLYADCRNESCTSSSIHTHCWSWQETVTACRL